MAEKVPFVDDDGTEYESMAEAARMKGVSRQYIHQIKNAKISDIVTSEELANIVKRNAKFVFIVWKHIGNNIIQLQVRDFNEVLLRKLEYHRYNASEDEVFNLYKSLYAWIEENGLTQRQRAAGRMGLASGYQDDEHPFQRPFRRVVTRDK